MKQRIRIRHTPYGLHPYVAYLTGEGCYGWGNTPQEARAKLAEQIRLARQQKGTDQHNKERKA